MSLPKPKRARIVKCQCCGELGHYKKTCPTRGGVTSSSSSSVARGLPPRAPNSDPLMLPLNNGIATPLSTSGPSNQHRTSGNDIGESDDSSDSDDDGEAAKNSNILDAVEEENPGSEVIDLTALDWVEYDIDPSEPLRTRTGSPVGVDETVPSFRPPRRGFSGPKIPYCKHKSASQLFGVFFTVVIMTQFVTATNSFANRANIRGWKDVTLFEMQKFFAVLMVLGVSCPPSRRMAWENAMFRIPIVCALMSRNRFEQIMRAWHFIDTSHMNAAQKGARNSVDPFWQVTPLIKSIIEVCKSSYTPAQALSIDEQCIPFKGRHKCRCYNPNKPEKWHFKVFSLNDAITGYQWNFMLYRGKEDYASYGDGNLTATSYPCYALTDDPILWMKNYILYTDNWYTSLMLAILMNKRMIQVCGTIKKNVKGSPKEHQFAKTGRDKKERGDMKQVKTNVDGTHLHYTSWMDKKPVHVLSTFAASKDTVLRAGKTESGSYCKISVDRPGVVGKYNYGMGGTDKFDQMLSYYRIKLRTSHWMRKIYVHLINLVMVNCHILYRDSRGLTRRDDNFRLLDFIETLIAELGFPEHETVPSEVLSQQPMSRRTLQSCMKDSNRVKGFHELIYLKTARGGPNVRKTCIWCGEMGIVSICKQCNVPVCGSDGSDDESCNYSFHYAPLVCNVPYTP